MPRNESELSDVRTIAKKYLSIYERQQKVRGENHVSAPRGKYD